MKDPVLESTSELRAWSVAVDEGGAPGLLKEIVKSSTGSGAQVLVLRSEMVFGLDHLRSALYHAKRAFEDRRNSSESLAMETLLYASGERQLSSAIKKMSVDQTTEVAIVVLLSGPEPAHPASWERLEVAVSGWTRERLTKFGLSDAEMAAVGEDRLVELVLERVAAVDVIKK